MLVAKNKAETPDVVVETITLKQFYNTKKTRKERYLVAGMGVNFPDKQVEKPLAVWEKELEKYRKKPLV